MAKPRRTAAPRPQQVTNADSVARPNVPVRTKRPAVSPPFPPSLWHTFVSAWLPLFIIMGVACAAVTYGFTTAPEYIRSKPLMVVFRRAFIALVCLTTRNQLHHVYHPPSTPPTLKRLAWAKLKLLWIVLLANCAGTTVIQPLIGQPPAYAKTIELVVPIYVAVEVAIGVFHVPTGAIQFVVGFLVSWLKAATTSTLVLKWQEDDGAHPVAFVLICTCNLFASGLVLRYVAHYHQSHRVVALSFGMLGSLVQMLVTGGFVGLLAYVANHFSNQQERQLEATVLYFAVAWYALDKYWKAPLRAMLLYWLTSEPAKAKTA